MRNEPEVTLMRELFVNDQQDFAHLTKWTILVRKYNYVTDQKIVEKIIKQPLNASAIETLSNDILRSVALFEATKQGGMVYEKIKRQAPTTYLAIVLNDVVVGSLVISQRNQAAQSAQVSLFLEENIGNRNLLAVNVIYILKTFGYKLYRFKYFVINTPMQNAKKMQWLALLHSRINLFSGAKVNNEPITIYQSVIEVLVDQAIPKHIGKK